MILIIGGAGYIGSHTNKLLNQKGYQTLVLDNLSTGHKEFVKWGEFVEGNCGDKVLLKNLLSDYPIKAIMHFGAFISVDESVAEPLKYYQNNVVNTLSLLEALIEHTKTQNISPLPFVFSSTAAIYGEPQYHPLDEDHPQNPINPYGWSKLM